MSQPFFLNMTPGFSVKFVINRITANYKIQITDTTNYTGVSSAYGFYRIEYPDGIYVENTNENNPDFEIGENFSEFNLRLKNSTVMVGQYRIIQKIFANTGNIETVKIITFSFVEPVLSVINKSSLSTPNVVFEDVTSYNIPVYTEEVTRVFSCNFPDHLPISSTTVTTTSSILNVSDSGSYYEGIYRPTLSYSVVFSTTSHVIEWEKSASFSFDIRKLLGYSELLEYLNIAKDRYDQSLGTTNESRDRETYQLVASIVDHIRLKVSNGDYGISELMYELQEMIYKITCTYNDQYEYSQDPLVPADQEFFVDGVPLDRVLTINGVPQDLTSDRSWNVGTVTSVNIQPPIWMNVSGGPITQSGSFQLNLASGYYIPTTADVARWDQDIYVTGINVTGTNIKTITITRNDGVSFSAQWNDINTFPVSSVNSKIGAVVLVTDDISEGQSPTNLWFTQSRARLSLSLSNNGNSGPATYSAITGSFNIPNYTLSGLGGVPLSRSITINGQTQNLSQNRTFFIDIGVASVSGSSPISVSAPSGNISISHENSGVTPGTYNKITVDSKGHVTSGENASEEDNFVRVLKIPAYAINFNNDIKEEIADYISQMDPPLIIDNTDSKWNVVIEYSDPELLDENTEINIWVDTLGSMSDVFEPIFNTVNSCLKNLLLPIYGDSNTYNQRVKINSFVEGSITINGNLVSFPGKDSSAPAERTFYVLNTMGSSDSITRVINLVFQDEAQPIYYAIPFDGTPTSNYVSDVASLKSSLGLKPNLNYYKSVIYQLTSGPGDAGATAFKPFLQAASAGTGGFSGVNSLSDLISNGRLAIEYDRQKSTDPYYYLGLIRETLVSIGFANINPIDSLICFIPITGIIVTSCTSSTSGTINVINVSGGSGSGYFFTLNGGSTEYSLSTGATGISNGSYQVNIFDDDGNNYLLGTAVISCSSPLVGTAAASCTGPTNGSGSINVTGVSGGSGSGYYFNLNGNTTPYAPGTPVTGLNDGSYTVVLYDGAGSSKNLGTLVIACAQTYNINVLYCGTCTQFRTGAVAYDPAFPLIIGKFYILSTGDVAQVTGLSTFTITDTIPNTFSYYDSCAAVPCP
jgi:hypothetical protein